MRNFLLQWTSLHLFWRSRARGMRMWLCMLVSFWTRPLWWIYCKRCAIITTLIFLNEMKKSRQRHVWFVVIPELFVSTTRCLFAWRSQPQRRFVSVRFLVAWARWTIHLAIVRRNFSFWWRHEFLSYPRHRTKDWGYYSRRRGWIINYCFHIDDLQNRWANTLIVIIWIPLTRCLRIIWVPLFSPWGHVDVVATISLPSWRFIGALLRKRPSEFRYLTAYGTNPYDSHFNSGDTEYP